MITSIRLQNVRSYKDTAFEFESGVNIIIGPNGSGKTNLLEGLLVACKGKSYRTKDTDIITHGKNWARIDMYLDDDQMRSVKLSKQNDRVLKEFEIEEKKLKRLNLNQTIPVVLFEPNQLQQLTTSPDQRRQFIDELLEQTDADFAMAKRTYQRILAQRNRLLKSDSPSLRQEIFVWNIQLSEIGARIVQKRLELIEYFNDTITNVYQKISTSNEKLLLAYESKHRLTNYASDLLKKYEQNIEKEILNGYTLYGPHRDDILITLDNQPIQVSASRGEVRTILLGLKMHEVELIAEKREVRPVLLLDDVFGELDGKRRKTVTDFLQTYQTFITTTDADIVVKNFKHINAIALGS